MGLINLHALRIEELSVMVHLGCTEEERTVPQEVRVTAEFRFLQPPRGVETDALADTICYAEVSRRIDAVAARRDYQLIEKLAGDVFLELAELTRGCAQVGLRVHKVRPPVDRLHGGSHYLCGDFFL